METLDAEGVRNKYGVAPKQIADYLALRGDSVDNIVGIKGIGDKTAAQLLEQYHSIDELIEQADSIKQPRIKESIIEAANQLIENKQLVVLTGDVDVTIEWDDIITQQPDESKLLPLLDELQFAKIRERLMKQGFINAENNVNDKAESAKVLVVPLSLDEAFTKLEQSKETAVGFSEQHVDLLFLMQNAGKSIYEICLTNDADWNRLIHFLDNSSISKAGWQLKPLLKKISGLDIYLKSEWIDLSLAAYLLEPDAKIEWSFIKDKYQLTEFSVDAPYHHLSYLPSIIEAHVKIMSKINDMDLPELYFNIELPLQ